MLIDTDVIIWYMRGNRNARQFLLENPSFHLSAITYMELVQGMRNKQELLALKRALKVWKAKIIYVNEEISAKAVWYMEQYYLSHAMELADALIAATSAEYGLPLATGNFKHYRYIGGGIHVSKFKPEAGKIVGRIAE